ncbi:MAG: hypothetical protein WD557_17130 [Dehalococcoidia bacterium]
MSLDRLAEIYRLRIDEPGLEPHLLILLSFLVTFGATRAITHSIRRGGPLPFVRNLSHGDSHLHHLVPGIILLLVVGYVLAATDPGQRAPFAVLYGIGAALTLDEFALWLQLKDVYWEREGTAQHRRGGDLRDHRRHRGTRRGLHHGRRP